jgi:NADH dehydrogenase
LTSQQRFAQLSRYLPVLPVFGKGDTRFQPVYAGDIGRLVDILTRDNVIPITNCKGKIIEAVGPEGEFSYSAQVERP